MTNKSSVQWILCRLCFFFVVAETWIRCFSMHVWCDSVFSDQCFKCWRGKWVKKKLWQFFKNSLKWDTLNWSIWKNTQINPKVFSIKEVKESRHSDFNAWHFSGGRSICHLLVADLQVEVQIALRSNALFSCLYIQIFLTTFRLQWNKCLSQQ